MKNSIYTFLFLSFSYGLHAQKYTEQQVERSNDTKVIAAFIKDNPNHPRIGEFKRRLYSLISSSSTPPSPKEASKTSMNKTKAQGYKTEISNGNQKTAKLLTHLFSNDPHRKEAYIHIKNKSKCNLLVKIDGKKRYNLSVPANKDNYVLVEKGKYTLSTSVCDAKYSEIKTISKDTEISLSNL